jgi:CubicO group peptidase (beta-lactamase class C family)
MAPEAPCISKLLEPRWVKQLPCMPAERAPAFPGKRPQPPTISKAELRSTPARAGPLMASFQPKLDRLVSSFSSQYNVSISVSVKLDEGREYAAAAGSHGFSARSKVPSGSAVKPFTAVALLQLSLAGRLELDMPIAPTVDAWRTTQSLQPLRSVFEDPRIEAVTARQLLSHQSGIKDYDDARMFERTLTRHGGDISPEEYIRSAAAQPFAFPPGSGGVWYSGNNFVLAGEVLAATVRAPSWEALDQKAALTPAGQPALELNDTIFMGRGPVRGETRLHMHPSADRAACDSAKR